MSDKAAIVEMKGVGRRFGAREVVAGVDLTVSAGEVVGVVGPNGGGKSTLLMLAAGLLRPTAGHVKVCGKTAHELALKREGLIGLVTARPGLYPLLTGWENLRHFTGLFGISEAEERKRANPLLKALDLGDGAMETRIGTWSTGMQQKLSLVRALLLSPRLLLFDEPTANLDPVAARTLYTELRKRADEGLACLLVTHDLQAAESICDRALLFDGGIKQELRFAHRKPPEPGPLLAAWTTTLGVSS